ncbi:hypothetical protein ACFJIW_03730 [Tahibacter sp. UC22_41]|uniref:hypothetical protein n=1 Tax=Tahibacter sp. UC22_41 TaxID=3350178 RepID=UPI0036D86FB0
MECFEHENASAVGVCKSCGKGVCRVCAIPVERGLACSPDCQPLATALAQVQETWVKNLRATSAARVIQPVMAVLFMGMGALLFLNGYRDLFTGFTFVMGAVIGVVLLSARRNRSPDR